MEVISSSDHEVVCLFVLWVGVLNFSQSKPRSEKSNFANEQF